MIITKMDLSILVYENILNQGTQVQILNEIVCISHSTNTLWKGMNPFLIPPAMDK